MRGLFEGETYLFKEKKYTEKFLKLSFGVCDFTCGGGRVVSIYNIRQRST